MATIAHFRLPLSGFPLGPLVETEPDRRVELERIVPGEEGILPFFWVWDCPDPSGFLEDVRELRVVREIERVSTVEDGSLYRARWNADVEGFVHGLSRSGATIVEGWGTIEGWHVELRFANREQIRTFREYCIETDVPLELDRLFTLRKARNGASYGLTTDQRETIQTAYAEGYFEEPRAITQTELATRFDVSQRAISRRLRRGLARLVGATVGGE